MLSYTTCTRGFPTFQLNCKRMSPVFRPCTFFLLLLLLGISENLAREIAKGDQKNIETAYGSHHDDHQHTTSSSSSTKMNPSLNVFFHIDDLKAGNKIPFYFPTKDPSTTPHIIPKQEADSIPFSSSQIPKILDFFSFAQESPQAKAMKDTLFYCELPPIKGGKKFCATSLESMLDNLGHVFGLRDNLKVLTTTQLTNWKAHLQNYTILEEPKKVYASQIVSCHPMPYPYAVFYCHGQDKDNKLFVVSLEGEEDGMRLEALGICHMDTSGWDPNHASFQVLGIEPGTVPVCHVSLPDTLVWVANASPSSAK